MNEENLGNQVNFNLLKSFHDFELMMLVCKHENVSMWALSMYISRYITPIEGDYNKYTYNIGIYSIVIL